jgi:protein-S-isoprenylcysteine O-methyltransferase Ste14
MTRLADAVAHGRIGEAAGADAAGVAILGVLAVIAVTYLVRVLIRKDEPPAWMRSPLLVMGLVALVAIHWVTTIITGGLPSS